MKQTYLGDSVYAYHDNDREMIAIYTDNGYGAINRIYLEDMVMQNLIDFYKIQREVHDKK